MCRMKRHHVDMVFSLYNHVRRFCGVLVGMLHSRSLVFQEWIMVFTPSIRQRSAICYLLLSGQRLTCWPTLFVLWRTVTRSHFTPIMVTVMRSWARCFKIHLGCFSPPRGFIRYQQTVMETVPLKSNLTPPQSSVLNSRKLKGVRLRVSRHLSQVLRHSK